MRRAAAGRRERGAGAGSAGLLLGPRGGVLQDFVLLLFLLMLFLLLILLQLHAFWRSFPAPELVRNSPLYTTRRDPFNEKNEEFENAESIV